MIRAPKLCRRKDTGRLFCTDPRTRKQVYFASQMEYENWRSEFVARALEHRGPEIHPVLAPPAGARLTVEQFGTAFLDHARVWYRKDGKPTSQVDGFRSVVRYLDAALGERRLVTLRATDIEAVLRHMIAAGLIRRTINAMLAKIKTMAKWGVKSEYMTGETLGRILAVRPLQAGRTAAKEKPKVGAVDPGTVLAVLEKLRPIPRAMVELQWLSGMRPGEVCRMRPAEIDRSREPWEYRPARYKTEHRHEGQPELRRLILFGGKCRAILEPLLKNAAPDQPLFRTNRGTEYDAEDLWGHVIRACKRAGVPRFAPNSLRHAAGTAVRRAYGIEAARVYLGHENLKTTEVYANSDLELARKVAEAMG